MTDAEIEQVYKIGRDETHVKGLRDVYEAGRGHDERELAKAAAAAAAEAGEYAEPESESDTDTTKHRVRWRAKR